MFYFFAGISDVSVSLSPNGWAWLVHGRRLVVWRYAKSSTHKPFSANCRELTLPPSDLAHNAKLVNVFATNQNQTPSCIAVSPEGIVRYSKIYNLAFFNICVYATNKETRLFIQ